MVKPRRATGNLTAPGVSDSPGVSDFQPSQDYDENSENIVLEVSDYVEAVPAELPVQPGSSRKKGVQQLIEIERRKLEIMENRSKIRHSSDTPDEDMAFFTSLLPHVRKLSPKKKLRYRMAVQQITMDHVYNEDHPVSTAASNSTPQQLFLPDETFNDQELSLSKDNSIPPNQTGRYSVITSPISSVMSHQY